MNATELAENLLKNGGNCSWFKEIATMLRQQQAEIEALKAELIMEEESYMLLDEECLFAKEAIKQQQEQIEALKYEKSSGVYDAEPADLTDEEIEEVYRAVEQDFALTESKKPDGGWRNFPVELGRAILRKAQEK